MANFSWEFACPKFVDFTDTKVLELDGEDADAYFESEHEFSYPCLEESNPIDSLLAAVETMQSPVSTPNRPGSSSSNYRTPEGGIDKNDSECEVFYTSRKSYSLRETESRRLKQMGASPFRIPGGTTTSKKKSRRPPLQPKSVVDNVKQIEEEEILIQNLKKVLFLDEMNDLTNQNEENIQPESTKIEEREQKASGDDLKKMTTVYIENCDEPEVMENCEVPAVIDNIEEPEKIEAHEEPEMVENHEEIEKIVNNSKQSEEEDILDQDLKKALFIDSPSGDLPKQNDEIPELPEASIEEQIIEVQEETKEPEHSIEPVAIEDKDEPEVFELVTEVKVENQQRSIPEIRLSPQEENVSSSPEEGVKPTGGLNSDSCWTDVEDDPVPAISKTEEKRQRPLRRESFIKPSATLASTAKKADAQKRLYRLLSYTAPPRNKYRSLAEISRDFEKKIRDYTPPNLKATKAHWTPTKPVSPKLTAFKRKRKVTCVSQAEEEENIALNIKKNTFKATPFNKKTYLSTVNVGVKRVDPKPTTKPIPFSFRSEKRIQARKSKVSADLFNKLTSQSAKKAK